MRLTTKGRFAVTAMVDLAIRGGKGPVTLAGISERQKISLSYLEQLFGKLRRNNVVASVRGPGGGYCLARPASKISIVDIIVAVDEPLDVTNCEARGDCQEGKPCMTHDLWFGLNEAIHEYLGKVNLQQLVDGQFKAETGGSNSVVMKDVSKSSQPATA
ncbi:MAG: Rrf2 family transcriptional regulator [Gammaproteobacteria bacterium]|nr:Rrf2 family transcriptional regulator [Gammaproteobacteria bacterium]MBU1969697.1 Rrf2 family transcriptional regulator [Gammaproteobacteria bacterium]